jgi:hypothetical protein
MLKRSSVVAFVAFATVSALCQSNQPTGGGKPAGSQNKLAAPSTNYDRKQTSDRTEPAETHPDSIKWYTNLERPDWWLVIIGALTGIVIGWQSFETRRAAQAMRDSNLATASSQRARLSINAQHRDTERGHRTDRRFQLIATNFGKTIAEVFEVATKLAHQGPELFKHLETMDFPLPVPNRFREPYLIQPGEHWQIAEIDISEVVEPGMEIEIESGRRIAVWYGWIIYRDFVGQAHQRKFFYMYSGRNETFFAVGPEGSNTGD